MNKIAITAIALATALGFQATTASAAERHRPTQNNQQHRTLNEALSLGLIGAATGFVIGNAVGNDNSRQYRAAPTHRDWRAPAYNNRRQAARVRTGFEPWTRGWYNYCQDTYRSFNANTGTYRGFDGRNHFCEVPNTYVYRR